jgi:hypothetical protein
MMLGNFTMNPMLAAMKVFCDKSLADLCAAAEKEMNGTAYETLRVANGPRVLLAVCVTGEYEMEKVKKAIPVVSTASVDPMANLGRVVFDLKQVGGFGCFTMPFKSGSALILISAEPSSMSILERVFNLPP